mgnify:FL=1
MQIIVAEEALYRFQIAEPVYDRVIKMILRSYGGVFDSYVIVKEGELAKRLGLSKADVIACLNKLQAASLVHYLPQTDKPQLQWFQSRVDGKYVHIDHKYLAQRKEIQQQQIQSVINYVEQSRCRSIQLLEYFDDTDAPQCDICDVCLEHKRYKKQEATMSQIIDELLLFLSTGEKLLPEMVSGIAVGTDQEKIKAIRLLIDAGKITSAGVKYQLAGGC